MLGVSVKRVKALTAKMEPVILIGKGKENLTCIVHQEDEINSKIFFSRCFFFWGVILDLDKYTFPWQTYFLGGSS